MYSWFYLDDRQDEIEAIMPTYEYICESCGHEFEKLQSITARSLRKCGECKKMSLKRLIGAGSAVIFKGSGFYQTDYRSESYKKAAKDAKTSTEKKKTETKDTKPKDKKPAEKSKPSKKSENKSK